MLKDFIPRSQGDRMQLAVYEELVKLNSSLDLLKNVLIPQETVQEKVKEKKSRRKTSKRGE
jgi:hypothetical protein